MNNFASVGKRLRLYKFLAFLVFAFAAFIFATGTAHYLDQGAPRTWRSDPGTMNGHYVPMAPSDPEYHDILRQRWSEYLYFVFWSGGFTALALLLYLASRKPPTKALLLLAQSRNGLLTIPEISTTLDIDPRLAAVALRQLQKLQIASPRWQEFRKNIWEFPDYIQLPLEQSLHIAQSSGGRVSLKDLLAKGHSLDTAQQTLDTLAEKGLAQPDPAAPTPTVLLAAQ